MDMMKITLNVFDLNGEPTGETKEVSVSAEAVADIIDHAVQISIMDRHGLSTKGAFAELDEALDTYLVPLRK